MPLFGPPNVEKLKAKGDVKGLIKALHYKDAGIRQAAAKALGQIGSQSKDASLHIQILEVLFSAFKSAEGEERVSIAEAMGKLGAHLKDATLYERTLALFVATLEDADWKAREAAATALGQIGDPRAVEPLMTAFDDKGAKVRVAVVKALGEIGDARAERPLLAALFDPNNNVRAAAAKALDTLNWQPDKSKAAAVYWAWKCKWDKCVEIGAPAVEPLTAALGSKSKDTREAAARALGEIGSQLEDIELYSGAMEPLIVTLGDAEWQVRTAAAKALGQIGDPRAVQPLNAAIYDQEPCVRETAIEALGEIGLPAIESLVTALRVGVWDEHLLRTWYAHKAATKALGKIGPPAVESLIATLGDTDEDVRQSTVQALGEIGDATVIAPLIAVLHDTSERVRAETARALDNLGWHPDRSEIGAAYWVAKRQWDECAQLGALAAEPLVSVMLDTGLNKSESQAIAEAVVKIGAPAVAPLVAALGSEDAGSHDAAASMLVQIGAPALQPLIAALTDRDSSARWAIIEVLDKLGWRPDQSKAGAIYRIAKSQWDECAQLGALAVEPLIAALQDEARDVRSNAATVLGKIGVQTENAAIRARVIESLIPALEDQNSTVRWRVAVALDELGWQPENPKVAALFFVEAHLWDRCVEIGAEAVEPLVAALNRGDRLKDDVATALGKIGDSRAVPPLIAMLDRETYLNSTVVQALGAIGDSRAVGPLIAASNKRGYVNKEVVQAVGKIGGNQAVDWLTGLLDSYHNQRGELDVPVSEALAHIGDHRAVKPLLERLQKCKFSGQGGLRKALAEALVHLYHQGKLAQQHKLAILAVRDDIIQRHTDRTEYPGPGRSSDCTHTDEGIGVHFPI